MSERWIGWKIGEEWAYFESNPSQLEQWIHHKQTHAQATAPPMTRPADFLIQHQKQAAVHLVYASSPGRPAAASNNDIHHYYLHTHVCAHNTRIWAFACFAITCTRIEFHSIFMRQLCTYLGIHPSVYTHVCCSCFSSHSNPKSLNCTKVQKFSIHDIFPKTANPAIIVQKCLSCEKSNFSQLPPIWQLPHATHPTHKTQMLSRCDD